MLHGETSRRTEDQTQPFGLIYKISALRHKKKPTHAAKRQSERLRNRRANTHRGTDVIAACRRGKYTDTQKKEAKIN